jgi:hypothetical protein
LNRLAVLLLLLLLLLLSSSSSLGVGGVCPLLSTGLLSLARLASWLLRETVSRDGELELLDESALVLEAPSPSLELELELELLDVAEADDESILRVGVVDGRWSRGNGSAWLAMVAKRAVAESAGLMASLLVAVEHAVGYATVRR